MFYDSCAMLRRFVAVLLLALELGMNGALPTGEQIGNGPSHCPTSELLDPRVSLAQRPTYPPPFGSSCNDRFSLSPTGIEDEDQFMTAKPAHQGSPEAWFRDWIATDPSMYSPHILDRQSGDQHNDAIGHSNVLMMPLSGYDSFDRDWLHELATPKFTEKEPEFIDLEVLGLWDHVQWQHQPPSEYSGASYPASQATNEPRKQFPTDTFKSTQDIIRSPGASDFCAPTEPVNFVPQYGSHQGEHESSGDHEQDKLRQEEFALYTRRAKKSTKRGQKIYDVLLDDQDALQTHFLPDDVMAETPGDSGHATGTHQVSGNKGQISCRREKSKKRKAWELGEIEDQRSEEVLMYRKAYVLHHCEERFKREKIEIKAYANVLRFQQSPPIAILPDQNFETGEEFRSLLNPDLENNNNSGQSEPQLIRYIRNYKSFLLPLQPDEVWKFQSPSPNDATYLTKRMYSSINYFMGRRYLLSSELNLGETIAQLETKWINHIVNIPQKRLGNPLIPITSLYECMILSTTFVLYQIGLFYRLSIPFDNKFKIDEGNSIKKALNDLENFWMNFPIHPNKANSLPNESNEFWSEDVINEITAARKHPGGIPPEIRISKILLRQWFLKRNPYLSQYIKIADRKCTKSPFYEIIKDCAWLDYFSIQNKLN